jgi:predicted DNA-binding ribbon-helix-helix protein
MRIGGGRQSLRVVEVFWRELEEEGVLESWSAQWKERPWVTLVETC